MAERETDEHSGVETTGHEWDGIKELDNPLPRWWLWIFYGCIAFSVIYWILMPAWPWFGGATTGLLHNSARVQVEHDLAALKAQRGAEGAKLANASLEQIEKDPELQSYALAAGQSVFIAGCLGGLGRAAVQLALMRGARVAGNCRAAGREEALALGVDEVADYRAFEPRAYASRFDLVFDTAGALSLAQCAAMLRGGGVAVHAVPSPGVLLAGCFSSRHALASGRPNPSRMAGVAEAAERGVLVPKIGRVVPLSDAIQALTELEATGLPKGKLVIAP